VDTVTGAWADWKAEPGFGVYRYKRTRAVLVHGHAVRRALVAFADDARIRSFQGLETCAFLCDDRVLFRMKKGDDEGRTSNIETQHSLDWHDPQATLFDLPDVHRVDIAYLLDRLQTEIIKILVVGRDKARIVWSYDILGRARGTATITPFPVQPSGPRAPLVRIRESAKPPRPDDRKAGDVD
jgi:hypothetical protein